jgi:hypothetical protein
MRFSWENRTRYATLSAVADFGIGVVMKLAGVVNMSILANPLYWDKKIRIAILTLATFIAMC